MVAFASVALAVLGAIFGSFASALIPRLREGRKMSRGRSECPSCGHTLSVLELVPVLSFLALRGKCAHCGVTIPAYHFLLEIAMVLTFLAIGTLVDLESVVAGNWVETVRLATLLAAGFVAVTLSAYDLLYMEVPDEVILPFLLAAFALIAYDHFSGTDIFSYYLPFASEWLQSPLSNAVLWAAGIFAFFLAQILVSKGAWMGGGDLRIAIFMGLVGGAKIAVLGLFLAYLLGSVVWVAILAVKRSRNIAIPFGPYLAAGLFLALFFHEGILEWYFGLLNI